MRVIARDGAGEWGGRIVRAAFDGSAGSVTISGEDLRGRFGLQSTHFTPVSTVSRPSYPRDYSGDGRADLSWPNWLLVVVTFNVLGTRNDTARLRRGSGRVLRRGLGRRRSGRRHVGGLGGQPAALAGLDARHEPTSDRFRPPAGPAPPGRCQPAAASGPTRAAPGTIQSGALNPLQPGWACGSSLVPTTDRP